MPLNICGLLVWRNRKLLQEDELAFEALTSMDTATSHPLIIAEININVTFIFLPPRTAYLLELSDESESASFKAYY